LLTFAAGPLAKANPLNPDLTNCKPWYNNAALKLALDDPASWNSPNGWNIYFDPRRGSMLRCCTSLVVVDGVKTITASAAARDRRNNGAATVGFWPFSIPSREQPLMRILGDGKVTIESEEGNPLILGVNVQCLPKYLGAACSKTDHGSILVRNA
jgi:hypothetical protein